ncbi:MAG: MerR family transcriptional regulator [Lachnospiraceae bacterium]|nr:MerR family transcriptional regulator [Lachnospiraceae bacterium]
MDYKINELAKLLGITTMTIRRYENHGYISPRRDESDYRHYSNNDISRIAEIRLLRKCGLTHEKIEELLGSPNSSILSVFRDHLAHLDSQISRLQFLRHWLKDNIEMIERTQEIGESFITFDNPPMYYVTYSIGEKLLKDANRLTTINGFMYSAEEVQLIRLYKRQDLSEGRQIPHRSWAIKEKDVSRLHLEGLVYDNPCVEYYPGKHCIYSTVTIPGELLTEPEKRETYIAGFLKRSEKYFQKNKLVPDGDAAVFVTDVLGETATFLVCLPAKPL